MKNMKKYLSNQRGITLIEILAVIVIIGILAAIAVPAVMGQIDKAKAESQVATERIIQDAAERYFLLEATTTDPVELSVLVSTKYLKNVPEGYAGDDTVSKAGVITK